MRLRAAQASGLWLFYRSICLVGRNFAPLDADGAQVHGLNEGEEGEENKQDGACEGDANGR